MFVKANSRSTRVLFNFIINGLQQNHEQVVFVMGNSRLNKKMQEKQKQKKKTIKSCF